MCCRDYGNRRYGWCPEDPKGREHWIMTSFLKETMGSICGAWWLSRIEELIERRDQTEDGLDRLIWEICQYDGSELAELLYPRFPELFRQTQNGCGTLSLCAFYGSLGTLWTLLELGADPDGLDCLGEHGRFIDNRTDAGFRTIHYFATPLDYAEQEEQEDCRLVLEFYGGRTSRELLGGDPRKLPRFFPAPDLGEEPILDDVWFQTQKKRMRARRRWENAGLRKICRDRHGRMGP